MAIIRESDDIRDTLKAVSFKTSNFSPAELREIEDRMNAFNGYLEENKSQYIESAQHHFKSVLNDNIIGLADTIYLNTSHLLDRDYFVPITMEKPTTRSKLTMSRVASHPRVQTRVSSKTMTQPYVDTIGRVKYDSKFDNPYYMNTYLGDYDNPYSEEVIIDHYEANSLGYDYEMRDVEKENMKEMNLLIDSLLNISGIL